MEGRINPLLGAIAGDTIGSVYEWHNIKSTEFPLFVRHSHPTDDSVMSLALAEALVAWRYEDSSKEDYELLSEIAADKMREWGTLYPHAGYGGTFKRWLRDRTMGPYGSCGNGSAMRISPVAMAANDEDECRRIARAVTRVTHNHPEGMKGAEATAIQVFRLFKGWDKTFLKAETEREFYPLDFTLEEIRPSYSFGALCQNTCPQAFEAFYEGDSFENVIRLGISIGGDSDTIGAIAGALAGAVYPIPDDIADEVLARLYPREREALEVFSALYAPNGLV